MKQRNLRQANGVAEHYLSDNPVALIFGDATLMRSGQGPRKSVVCCWPRRL